jgi:hypothetical protein
VQEVLDGDTYMLHVCERELYWRGGDKASWKRAYYMPSDADTAVIALRQWCVCFPMCLLK